MIHSARSTVQCSRLNFVLFCEILKSGNRRTDNTCENSDHYLPWLWVGHVDHLRKEGILSPETACHKTFIPCSISQCLLLCHAKVKNCSNSIIVLKTILACFLYQTWVLLTIQVWQYISGIAIHFFSKALCIRFPIQFFLPCIVYCKIHNTFYTCTVFCIMYWQYKSATYCVLVLTIQFQKHILPKSVIFSYCLWCSNENRPSLIFRHRGISGS